MDGMDQEKTQLPHFIRSRKTTGQLQRVAVHLTGVLVHGRSIYGYFDYGQWPHSANMNGTILLDVLAKIDPLPPILYLQLDNAADNKNQILLGLFCLLVEKKLFRKVKVNFLMVGHTHENIDQMFSCYNKKLHGVDAFTMAELMSAFKASYSKEVNSQTLTPSAVELETVFDIKGWIQPYIQKMKYHTGPHCYKIECDSSGKAVISYKHWSYDQEWQYAIAKDDTNPTFLVSHPTTDSINLAETQYGKMIGIEDSESAQQSPVIATIRRCYPIMNNEDIKNKWENWIQEAENHLEGERYEKENGIKTAVEFSSFKSLLRKHEQRSSVSIPRATVTSDILPENQPIKEVIFGKVNRLFRCKSAQADADVNGRYKVGDMVLLHVDHWNQMNQVGRIIKLSEHVVTICWYDGMPTTAWKEFKRRAGKKMQPYEEEVLRHCVISDGFRLTRTGHLPGEVKEAIQAYWSD